MNTDHSAHVSYSSDSPGTPFTPSDVQAFAADDRGAATAIVGLMAGIFTIGLCGYALVCVWVSS
jgi:hypothetical protein